MKYGEQFEKESVPQWSLHNIDYNSLKHYIKVHTTRDQATAIAIPGQPNTALSKFEDEFYSELCRQHDRVDLFVLSKADEISRRLQHLSGQIHRLILRCATSGTGRMPFKRQQRFAKYEQILLRCGDDIQSLQRFISAQAVAFRKILKKYKKWTGSSALGARFREGVLSNPKSFTKRDFSQVRSQHDDLLRTLHAALPPSGLSLPEPETDPERPPTTSLSPGGTLVAEEPRAAPATGYWNEYECGSEAGDFQGDNEEDGYAIYIDPNADEGFPGMKALGKFFSTPIITKITGWVSSPEPAGEPDLERGPLLFDSRNAHGHPHSTTHNHTTTYGSIPTPPESASSYFTSPPGGLAAAGVSASPGTALGTDTDLDDDHPSSSSPHSYNRHYQRLVRSGRADSVTARGYTGSSASSTADDNFPPGYRAYYAARHDSSSSTTPFPSVTEQRMARDRDRALVLATWGCFSTALVLTGIAGVLVIAGKHKMQLEVDAGVTVGIMTSLGLATAGLCVANAREEKVMAMLGVYLAFVVVCVVDGILLVFVVGNTGI
ncbi:SPX domain-containing protein [Dichotomopilus funicola]|uniref:SPX domain-containing protein n=1 Tax=Dichotomopilus funicola TaxID=1934379 RepID=A0AAN6V202_9PEZI|nr:SPX domain-containing protein [Dichotomopilus funicola]